MRNLFYLNIILLNVLCDTKKKKKKTSPKKVTSTQKISVRLQHLSMIWIRHFVMFLILLTILMIWLVIFLRSCITILDKLPHLKQDLNPIVQNYLGLMMTFLVQDVCIDGLKRSGVNKINESGRSF